MSEEHVRIAELGYERFRNRDLDGFLELCAPDVEWQDHGAFDTAPVVGREAVRAHLAAVLEPWEEFSREPEEIIDLGDNRVLGLVRATGRGKGSGVEVDVRGGDLLTIQDGLVVRFAAYPREQALEAAGIRR